MQYPFDKTASLEELIPEDIRSLTADRRVTEAGFGAGPGFVAVKRWTYDPPVTISEALTDLEKYRQLMRRCHVEFTDTSKLFWERYQFLAYKRPEEPARSLPPAPLGEGILRKTYAFEDFENWDDTLFECIMDFAKTKGVHPNIMSASMEVYDQIDDVAKHHRDNVVDAEGNGIPGDVEFTLSSFSCEEATVEFTTNEVTQSPRFILIFDEDPDFDGEPIVSKSQTVNMVRYRIA